MAWNFILIKCVGCWMRMLVLWKNLFIKLGMTVTARSMGHPDTALWAIYIYICTD